MLKKTGCLFILLFSFLLLQAQIQTTNVDWNTFLSKHDLTWDSIPPNYYAGAITGNGLLGTNIYADTQPDTYRFNIGRSDVNEMRNGSGTLYFRARLPIGHFQLKTVGPVTSEDMRIILYDATVKGNIETEKGGIQFNSFADANENIIVIEFKTKAAESNFQWTWIPGKAISPRTDFSYTHKGTPDEYLANPNPAPYTKSVDGLNLSVQELYSGYTYVTGWKEEKSKDIQRFYITVSFEKGTNTAIATAVNTLRNYSARPIEVNRKKHLAWWHNYYPASFASFGDKKMESFYWIQQYKFASMTRENKNIIDLMGPWTYSTPWPAIWWNLNIQLTYSPLFTANRMELFKPVITSLHKNIQSLHSNVPVKEWQKDAIAIGRSSSYDLVSPLRIDLAEQNQYEVGNLTWLLYYYWQYCIYKNDQKELVNKFFPLLKKSIAYYSHIAYKGDDGKYHLPLTASPEYLPAEDCNYDLSILKWGLKTLIDINKNYKLNDSKAIHWNDLLTNLTDFPIDDKEGYLIGKDVHLTSSHRHYSHLLMIYPFKIIRPDNATDKEIIEKSLKHWIGQRGALQGYSYTGASSISSLLGKGNDSYTYIKGLLDRYIQPNTLYKETGPVIETPLSAVASLQEMYIQSESDYINIFPSVPDAWKEASFIDFCAEKGTLVSAKRTNGKTCFVQLKAVANTKTTIDTNFGSDKLVVQSVANNLYKDKKYTFKDGVINLDLKPGETIIITTPSYNKNDAFYNNHQEEFSYGIQRRMNK